MERVRLNWDTQHDKDLAELVLSTIQSGSTAQLAFKKYSTETGRPFQSCKSRWNNILRKQYALEFYKAKKEGSRKISENSMLNHFELDNSISEELDDMTSEITLPRNRPINSLGEKMQQALKEKEERETVNEISQNTQSEESIKPKKPDTPFLRIRKLAAKMEREYDQLVESNTILVQENEQLKARVAELEGSIKMYEDVAKLIEQFKYAQQVN